MKTSNILNIIITIIFLYILIIISMPTSFYCNIFQNFFLRKDSKFCKLIYFNYYDMILQLYNVTVKRRKQMRKRVSVMNKNTPVI